MWSKLWKFRNTCGQRDYVSAVYFDDLNISHIWACIGGWRARCTEHHLSLLLLVGPAAARLHLNPSSSTMFSHASLLFLFPNHSARQAPAEPLLLSSSPRVYDSRHRGVQLHAQYSIELYVRITVCLFFCLLGQNRAYRRAIWESSCSQPFWAYLEDQDVVSCTPDDADVHATMAPHL